MEVLPKPFTTAELERRARALLATRPGSP